ncbi:MAG: hypothetical protein ABJH28_18425 [Paraglaciecola sp.]|uniref:hypothetical protein n=1 Tax=Paraglaciecola sp. TaxID=1920173 RepID=UPI0032657FA0
MVAFGVIGFLILLLVFIVTRNQSIQQEVKQTQQAHKTLQLQNKHSLGVVNTMSSQLQQSLQIKLTALQSHGLIKQADFEIVQFIIENFKYVILQCTQDGETVEIAIAKALKGNNLTIEDIRQFIAKQQSETRIPWCQNTVEGFVIACQNLTSDKAKVASTS